MFSGGSEPGPPSNPTRMCPYSSSRPYGANLADSDVPLPSRINRDTFQETPVFSVRPGSGAQVFGCDLALRVGARRKITAETQAARSRRASDGFTRPAGG